MKTSAPFSNFLLSQVAPGSPSLLTRAPPAENLAKGPKANFSVSNQRSLPLPPLPMAHKWPLSLLETVFPGLLGDTLPTSCFLSLVPTSQPLFPISSPLHAGARRAQLCLCPLLVPSTRYSLIPPSPDLLPCPPGLKPPQSPSPA